MLLREDKGDTGRYLEWMQISLKEWNVFCEAETWNMKARENVYNREEMFV